MTPVDLRSDTVTTPTPEMRRAMAEADVGDDVYGEDPTVNRLQDECAEATGKEAALFVPTGSMGNQIAITVWGRPGTEVVLDARGHTMNYELGAMAALAGLMPRPVPTSRGWLRVDDLRSCLRPPAYYASPLSVVVLEDTHNMAGGVVYPQEELDAVCAAARENGLRVHLDGARIWNAAAATGRSVARIARDADSVMFCFSKGLSAPVGSILCGPRDFVEEGRRVRKRLGGGMRQVGVLAAAALVALRSMPARLPRDHENARRLAQGAAGLPGFSIDPSTVETNIVIVSCAGRPAPALCDALRARGVLALPTGPDRVRFVTHKDVDGAGIDRALAALAAV